MTKLVRSLAVLLSCLPLAVALANGAVDVPVRVGSHEGYGRVVFDAPARTDYQLTQQDQRVEVRFSNEVTIAAPAGVPHNVLHITGGPGQAELVIAPGTVLRDWRFGDRIVIDVWDAGAAPRQATTQQAGPARASLPALLPVVEI